MPKTKQQRDSKKIVQQLVVADYETGEVKQETNVLRLPQEPAFIKLYIDDILYLHDMPKGLNTILQVFLTNMNWKNKLILNSSVKKEMAESIGLSLASIDKALTQLVKGGVLIREDKGVYLFNPYLFGKGSWEQIQEIRMTITYNLQGRSFSGHITKVGDIIDEQTNNDTTSPTD